MKAIYIICFTVKDDGKLQNKISVYETEQIQSLEAINGSINDIKGYIGKDYIGKDIAIQSISLVFNSNSGDINPGDVQTFKALLNQQLCFIDNLIDDIKFDSIDFDNISEKITHLKLVLGLIQDATTSIKATFYLLKPDN